MRSNTIWIIVLTLILVGIGLWYFNQKDEPAITTNNQEIEELKLDPDTKTFTSERNRISFRYDSKPVETFEVTVTEIDNKIYVHGTNEKPEDGKKIEVFEKPADVPLEQAIKDKFLQGYSEQDCWVHVYDEIPTDPSSRVRLAITFPKDLESDQPWWAKRDKCPDAYAEINAVRYFMGDTNVKDRYLFLDLGQDSITSDGSAPNLEGSRRDWSDSIKFL